MKSFSLVDGGRKISVVVLEEKHSKKKTNHGVSSIQLKIANVIAFIITLIFNGISSAGLISPFGIGIFFYTYNFTVTYICFSILTFVFQYLHLFFNICFLS